MHFLQVKGLVRLDLIHRTSSITYQFPIIPHPKMIACRPSIYVPTGFQMALVAIEHRDTTYIDHMQAEEVFDWKKQHHMRL